MKISFSLASLLFVMFLTACQTQSTVSDAYFYDEAKHAMHSGKRVLVAPSSLLPYQYRSLKNNAERVDSELHRYLNEKGFEIVSNTAFLALVEKERVQAGGYYDQGTGQFNEAKFSRILQSALLQANESTAFDLFIFPVLSAKQVDTNPLTRIGRWDGVERKMDVERTAEVVPTQPMAASLCVEIMTTQAQRIFSNCGGLEYMIEVKHEATIVKFVPKQILFTNPAHVREAVEVSFSPFIAK